VCVRWGTRLDVEPRGLPRMRLHLRFEKFRTRSNRAQDAVTAAQLARVPAWVEQLPSLAVGNRGDPEGEAAQGSMNLDW
jgi:hypothetical protein